MDVSKLPKWAQDHIFKLEADVKYLQSKFDEMSSGESALSHGTGLDRYGLPDRHRVEFTFDKHMWIEAHFNAEKNRVIVTSSGGFVISPRAYNSFELGVR
jgi:hypothetical protein